MRKKKKQTNKKKAKKNIPLGSRSVASRVLFVLVQVWVITTCRSWPFVVVVEVLIVSVNLTRKKDK